jgi:hypothetical protein
MVIVGLPVGVLAAVVIVRVELAPGAMEAGLKEEVAPVGRPEALKLTDPLNPFKAPTLTVYEVLPPWMTLCAEGVADSVKSGAGGPAGTIWMPLMGARGVPSEAAPGVAVSVKAVALIAKTT